MKPNYSATGLKRWSSKPKQIPDPQVIKSLHVYDFDNTLFCSPLPNPQIWYSGTIGFLQTYEAMAYGGWWHDPSILAATGEGIDKEEPKAWAGHWNETVVELVKCSMQDPDALTVLLTGRADTQFADLINRICNAKQLDFDLVVLKPEVGPTGEQYSSTMAFKQAFLHDLVFTYKTADDIKIYEDRPKHVKAFRDYFDKLNKSFLSHPVDQPAPPRKPINCEVIHVCELKSALDPKAEIEVTQKAIERHNQAVANGGPNPHKSSNKRLRIEENYLYFAYLINETDSARLISLTNVLPHLIDSGEVKYLASSILIAPYKPGRDLVQKVGGRGKKVMWQVNGISKLEDRIWAARVVPVDPNDPVHTQDQTPVVVLAIRKGSRPIEASRIQNWQPVSPDKAFMFQTTVGDKVMLKIEEVGDGSIGSRTGDRSRRRVDGDGGYKRKFGEDGDLRYNKENWPRPGGERDDPNAGWISHKNRALQQGGPGGGGGGHGQPRHFFQSKNQFNNRNNPNVSGNAGPVGSGGQLQHGGGGAGLNRPNNSINSTNANIASTNNYINAKGPRNSGIGGGVGGSRNRGGNRPPGYRSLDDYGSGSFDGAADPKGQAGGGIVGGSSGSGSGGQMVMDY